MPNERHFIIDTIIIIWSIIGKNFDKHEWIVPRHSQSPFQVESQRDRKPWRGSALPPNASTCPLTHTEESGYGYLRKKKSKQKLKKMSIRSRFIGCTHQGSRHSECLKNQRRPHQRQQFHQMPARRVRRRQGESTWLSGFLGSRGKLSWLPESPLPRAVGDK